jgi:thiosulfate dehydrogenase (quinone) large subunit
MIGITKHHESGNNSTASHGGDGSPRRIGLPAGLAVVQLILAYEWLVSGINKLVNLHFTVQLAGTLRDSISGNPYTPYVTFLREVVLPHATLFGILTEIGEGAIGLVLLGSAVLWLWRPTSQFTLYSGRAACAALAGAAFLSLNYFLQGGSPLPWVNPANAFNEGVDIDILLPLLSVTVLVANLRAVRAATARFATRQLNREWMPWAS